MNTTSTITSGIPSRDNLLPRTTGLWRLSRCLLLASMLVPVAGSMGATSFNAAPFGMALPEDKGVVWEDPRELHRVVVQFQGTPPAPDRVHLEYWGSWWPERHLPKDREPGGGDIGWMELGNWYKYGWRKADAEASVEGQALSFAFRPVTASEFPKVKDYPAAFRYTLKVRVVSDDPLPAVRSLQTFTDSVMEERWVRLAWDKAGQGSPDVSVFNGWALEIDRTSPQISRVHLQVASNPDPNTFDRTLVTVRRDGGRFTFKVDDLADGPLFLPHFGVAILPDSDTRDYAAVAAAQKARGTQTLYERVAGLPEQTWHGAWEGMPRKKSRIYFPMGLNGGRQRFR